MARVFHESVANSVKTYMAWLFHEPVANSVTVYHNMVCFIGVIEYLHERSLNFTGIFIVKQKNIHLITSETVILQYKTFYQETITSIGEI